MTLHYVLRAGTVTHLLPMRNVAGSDRVKCVGGWGGVWGGRGREFSHGRYPGTKLRAGWELDCKWMGRVGAHNRLTVSGVLHVRQSRVQLGRRGHSVLQTSLCGY